MRKRARPRKNHGRSTPKGQKSSKATSSAGIETRPLGEAAGALPVFILVLVSFVAYANAWPNELVWDDGVFAMGNRLSGVTWADIGDFFTQDVWASLGIDSGLYRPLLLTSVSLDILIFGEWKAGFHLVNILLHALCTVALFGLVRQVSVTSGVTVSVSGYAALMAAMVFAVHPVHTEVVNSVFNRSEMLAMLCVAGGLWWFLPRVERHPVKGWSVLAVIYLLALLSRETGIMLPAITVVLLWFNRPDRWKARVRRCLPVLWLLIPLALYFWLRAQALDIQGSIGQIAVDTAPGAAPEQKIPTLGLFLDFRKVLPAVAVWLDSMKLMVWPHPLMTYHNPSGTNVWAALAAQSAMLAFSAVAACRKKPGLFIGLVFFYLAILPTSQIVGIDSTYPHLQERYLYMPSAGAAIMLASGLNLLLQKGSLRQVFIPVLAVTILLTPLTWARNSKWTSTLFLAETDINQGGTNPLLLSAYLSALLREGEYRKAVAACNEHLHNRAYVQQLAGYCGQVHARLKHYGKAEEAFALAMEHNSRGRSAIHHAMAVMYLDQGRRKEAGEQFDLAADTAQKDFMKEYFRAEALIRLYPSNYGRLAEARTHLQKTIELQPQYLPARERLDAIDKRMAVLRRR